MKTIHINVFDKVATSRQRDGMIVCGNGNYQVQFTFDNEWDAHDQKTARFIWNGQYIDVPFTGEVCQVPVISNTLSVSVGVYTEDLSTTTPAIIECKKSILCMGGEASAEERERQADRAEAAADRAEAAADSMGDIEDRISELERLVEQLLNDTDDDDNGGSEENKTVTIDYPSLVNIPMGATSVGVSGTCTGYMSGGVVNFVFVDGNNNIIYHKELCSGADNETFIIGEKIDVPLEATKCGTYYMGADNVYNESDNYGYECNLTLDFDDDTDNGNDSGGNTTKIKIENPQDIDYGNAGLYNIPDGTTKIKVSGRCIGLFGVWLALVGDYDQVLYTYKLSEPDVENTNVDLTVDVYSDVLYYGVTSTGATNQYFSPGETYTCDLTIEFIG